MSLIDTARDALKDLAISDIVRERFSLALDRLGEAEAKIEDLQAEKGGLKAELERERLDHQKSRDELRRLKEEHAEEIRVHSGMEFRRGKRTGEVWIAFCPVCHAPADLSTGIVGCASPKCKWQTLFAANQLDEVIQKL